MGSSGRGTRTLRTVLLIFALSLTAPAAAAAATRYADPAGSSANPCSQASPCDIGTAINSAAAGDTVIVDSGTYGSAGSPISTELNSSKTSLTIRGAGSGTSRPLIYESGAVALDVKGSASDLTVIGQSSYAVLVLEAGATATRLYASNADTVDADACDVVGDGAVLTDSVCWAKYSAADSGLAAYHNATLRNDTLAGSTGLFDNGGSLQVVNCILRGTPGSTAPFADDYYGFGGSAAFTNVEYQTAGGNAPSSATGTVNAAPGFVNEAGGDFHETSSAPSIDAGTDDAANGANDLDGNLRQVGSHTDLGAYEYVGAPTASATAASNVKHTTMTVNGTLDAGGSPASYHFVYGTSSGSLTSSTPTQTLGAATGSQAVSADLSGLAAGTPYFYALVVDTNGGTVTSATQSASTTSVTTRYADPAGSATDPCTAVAPCDIVTAINSADTGDTVIVDPGTYGSNASPEPDLNTASTQLTIEGVGRPHIFIYGGSGLVIDGSASGLDVTGVGRSGALYFATGATGSRLIATSSTDPCAMEGTGITLTNSVCASTDDSYGSVTVSLQETAVLRNDTLIGRLDVLGSATVINSIVAHVNAPPDIYVGNGGDVTLRNDEFSSSTGTVTSNTGQVSAAPQFADAGGGDYHEAAGAPSIDAGLDDPANGPTDLDGHPRQLGTHTDIGAYEFIPRPTATVSPADGLSKTAATIHGAANPQGVPGTAHFVYGTSGSLTSSTPDQPLPAGTADQALSAALTGLAPGTTYTYELVVTTDGGTTTSTPLTFTTYTTTGPTITITSPGNGARYALHQPAAAVYSCADQSGAGIASCAGPVTSGGNLDTSAAGPHTFTVTASDQAGNQSTKSVTYSVNAPSVTPPAAPTVSITSPRNHGRYVRFTKVIARFSCAEGARGPGLRSCAGTVASGQAISTSKLGRRTFTVTATSADGLRTRQTVSYTVTAPSNRFTVSHITTPGDGTIGFTVKVPGAGGLEALASQWNDNFASVSAVRPAPNRSGYGSVSRQLRKGGSYRFVLRPNGKGRELIAAHRYSIVLRLVVQFTPTGGFARRLGFFHLYPVARARG